MNPVRTLNPVRAFAADVTLWVLKTMIVVYPVGLVLGAIYVLSRLLDKL